MEAAAAASNTREEWEHWQLRLHPLTPAEEAIHVEGCTCNDERFGLCQQCLRHFNFDPDYYDKLWQQLVALELEEDKMRWQQHVDLELE